MHYAFTSLCIDHYDVGVMGCIQYSTVRQGLSSEGSAMVEQTSFSTDVILMEYPFKGVFRKGSHFRSSHRSIVLFIVGAMNKLFYILNTLKQKQDEVVICEHMLKIKRDKKTSFSTPSN